MAGAVKKIYGMEYEIDRGEKVVYVSSPTGELLNKLTEHDISIAVLEDSKLGHFIKNSGWGITSWAKPLGTNTLVHS